MRKRWIILLAAFLCVGCSQHKEQHAGEEYAFFARANASEKGIYHQIVEQGDRYTYFYDFASDSDVPLCTKPNCNHHNKECDAYQLSYYNENKETFYPVYYKNKIYMFYEQGIDKSTYIGEADEDGSNRKILCELEEGVLTNAMFYQDHMYISINTPEKDETGRIVGLSDIFHNYVVDVKDGSMKQIAMDDFIHLYYIGAYKNQVYAQAVQTSDEQTSLSLCVLKDNTIETIRDHVTTNINYIKDGAMYYLNDEKTSIMKLSLETNEAEEWMEIPKELSDVTSINYDMSGIMKIAYVIDGTVAYYYMDMDTQKQIEDENNLLLKYDGDYFVEDASGFITRK